MTRCRTWVAIASLTMLSANARLLHGQEKMMDGMKMSPEHMQMMDGMKMSPEHMQMMMDGWPQASKDAVKFMTDKYGAPASMTAEMATWGKTGPWKRTIVYAKEYMHEFPAHHTDVMQQWIDYKAPPKSYSMLAAYDGSVVLERTSGEMSARCDSEGANFLAVNLADEIARGKRTVTDGRRMYGDQIMAMKAGKSAPYTERLMIATMTNTNDPDKAGAKPSVLVGSRR